METQSLEIKDTTNSESLTAKEIQIWLVSYVSEILDIKPDEVNLTKPLENYGLDSSLAVGLTGDLEEWLGRELDPTLLYDYPTIDSLTCSLVKELG